MKKRITRLLSIALMGGATTLLGCEKMPNAELSPKATQTTSVRAMPTPTGRLTSVQAAWLRFVDRVERGEIIDPSGQYVAKGSNTSNIGAEGNTRVTRSKFDAATPEFARHYRLLANGEVTGVSDLGGSATEDDGGPTDICDGCEVPGQGIYIPPTPRFASSEGNALYSGPDNPNGYLYDIKVIASTTNSASTIPQPYDGYTRIPVDLNEGAGGLYIYYVYTRNPSSVLHGPEVGLGRINSTGPVTAVQTKSRDHLIQSPTTPSWTYGFYPIWAIGPQGNHYELDLNENAGGDYIYSYRTHVPNATPIEIGVVSGNSDQIRPPQGWERDGVDLNKGAGGSYVYLCYKYR